MRTFAMLAVTVAIAGASAPAFAGYDVAAISSAGSNGLNIGATAAYNYAIGVPGVSLTGAETVTTSTLCNGTPNADGAVCSYGVSVVPNTSSSTATSTSTSASFNFYGAPEFGVTPFSITGSASAAASLAGGRVGVAATGTLEPFNAANSGGGSATAVADDNVTFHVAGATASTVTDIGVTFTITGSPSPATAEGAGQITVIGTWDMNGSYLQAQIGQVDGTATVDATPAGLGTGWVTAGVSPGSSVTDYTMTAEYAITGPSTTLPIELSMYASCGGGSSCDYSHTGQISFDLPSGVSFTSDSGVFLTAEGVPEPGTLAILAGALAILPVLRRGRDRIVQH